MTLKLFKVQSWKLKTNCFIVMVFAWHLLLHACFCIKKKKKFGPPMCSSNGSRAGRRADKPLYHCICAWHSLHVTCELPIFIPFFQGIADLVKEHLVLKQKCSPQLLMRCPMCPNDACKNMRRWIETLPWLTFHVVFTAEKKLTCAEALWSHWAYDS